MASYRGNIVFYSIPPDIFHGAQRQEESHDNDDSGTLTPISPDEPKPKEPLIINGCYIDAVPKIIDLAVDSGPAMAVYAFSTDGLIRVYQLEDTKNQANGEVVRHYVLKAGELAPQVQSADIPEVDGAKDGEGESKQPWWADSDPLGAGRIWQQWYRTGWMAEGEPMLECEVS